LTSNFRRERTRKRDPASQVSILSSAPERIATTVVLIVGLDRSVPSAMGALLHRISYACFAFLVWPVLLVR
jgi:hypothetical protein